MLSDKAYPEDIHVENVQKRQYKYYNIMVIAAMSFTSIGMGYSASIIGTTLGIHSTIPYIFSNFFASLWGAFMTN
jgi:hypothetical protein